MAPVGERTWKTPWRRRVLEALGMEAEHRVLRRCSTDSSLGLEMHAHR